ncbi:MAG: lytic murein transglycosylase, partial [Proteobacteria bacterium]|nr:lytic murein transglycosylase [Pseudomonadota bacterium]
MRIILAIGFMLWAPLALADASFDEWLTQLRKDAVADGISDTTLDAALKDVKLIERVIELDRSQPEFTLTFAQYLERVVPVSRQKRAKARFNEHRDLLTEIGQKYGVQPRFVVALWGIETDFGRVQGGFKVIPALVTLAYDGRRSEFFRKELMDALHILEEGHISAEDMNGSWAGAMGQSQFMPSSFRQYAEDYNKDGHKDIWSTQSDVFASAANYLKSVGWQDDMTWGRLVKLPSSGIASPDKAMTLHDNKTKKSLPEWAKLGVLSAD